MHRMRLLKGKKGYAEFAKRVGLSHMETESRLRALKRSYMPFQVTDSYTSLIERLCGDDKSNLINIVTPFEGSAPFKGRFDPYGNVTARQDHAWFLQHKYEPTLLVHIADYCISNCQFCYKVHEIRHEEKDAESISRRVDAALAYIDAHPQINNVLLTGGDPVALKPEVLINCMERLLSKNNIRLVRLATKAVVFDPTWMLASPIMEFLSRSNSRSGKQISVIAQINHPAEFSDDARTLLDKLTAFGIQIRGQPTIASGINVSPDTLFRLHQIYIDHRIIPYYFTVFMPVRGVEQYAVELHVAFRAIAEAKKYLSGLEKKSVLLASHDFGKFEICGFLPDAINPRSIILKWHQAAMPSLLPNCIRGRIPSSPEDVLVLKYLSGKVYCIDQLFAINGLPYFTSDGTLQEKESVP